MPTRWDDMADTLRRRTRWLVSLRGVTWLGLLVVGLLWTIGFADWFLHLDSSWLRLLLAVSVVVVIGVTAWRTLWCPLRVKLSDVDVARMIERRFPVWGDRLSSAAQFRKERFADRLGSPDLQRIIASDVDAHLDEIDVEDVLEPRPTRRLAVLASIVSFIGVTGALWHGTTASTALTRMVLPFADVAWPRTTEFQFLDADLQPITGGPLRTAAGEPLSLYVENVLGPLPEDALLELRLADGRREQRALQMTVLRDTEGSSHEIGISTLTTHNGPIEFRAVGGDDYEMPWRLLDVVAAPALSKLTITVTPPSYTAQEPRVLDGAGAVEALVGSRIRFEGAANTPLGSAAIRREDHPPQEMETVADRRHVRAEFVVEEPGREWYWFDIADVHGLSPGNPPRYELRGVADRQPTVFIEQPGGDVTVTADADLPLRILVRDDLGVKALQLVHTRPNAPPASWPLEMPAERPTHETVETVWSLTPLGLTAGDRITFHAEAVDAFDLPAPLSQEAPEHLPELDDSTEVSPSTQQMTGHVGISARRHITILSSEDKSRELAARQMKILDSLNQLQERQSRVLESTAGLRIQAELTNRLPTEDVDLLKQTELEQQAISSQFSEARSGIAGEVDHLRQELDLNRIDDLQLAARLEQLAADIGTLTGELLPTAEQSLARARKSLQPSAESEDSGPQQTGIASPEQQLRRAEQAQVAAIAVLTEATAELASWRRHYEVTSEVDDLIVNQTDIQQETQETGRETLTKQQNALTPQQQADLARLSDRQRRLASRLEELVRQGTGTEPDGSDRQPAAEAMQEALRRLADRQTAGHMHNAAESLRRNDIASTARSQEQVLTDLRDFGELLHSADETARETLLSTLEEQVEEVETLRKRQEQLARGARQAMGPTADPQRKQQLERLMKEQEQLAQRAEDLARQLRRQQNRQSALSAARAARRMRDARQGIDREQPEQTTASQQEALDDLTQLAEELAQQQREIEQELARQQVEQLADDLEDAADRQAALITQTVGLAERQSERGSWSRSLRKELREATDEQATLAGRLDELRQSLGDFPVIVLSLEHVMSPMNDAAERMQQTDVGHETVERQRTAHQRLLAIIDVTKQSSGSQEQAPPDSGPPQRGQPPPGAQQPPTPQLLGTQLRLLRHLQADVHERTATLTEQLQNGASEGDSLAGERESLALDQSRIAELTRRLLEEFSKIPRSAAEGPSLPEEQP